MDRLEKLINILKLTPHYQPDLVKEACSRILSRSIRKDAQARKRVSELLRPLIEILIQYCDTEDSAQRSLFNDYLNTVVLNFQHSEYFMIFDVFVNQVTNNGSARTVVAALHRLPYLIQNVQPIELGCEPQRLLKALIEVCRRSEDESVLKALDVLLPQVIPYLDHSIKTSKDMQMLSNSLIELLLKNLQHDSMQTKRLAASSLATLSSISITLRPNIMTRLSKQLDSLNDEQNHDILSGFSLCVKLIPDLSKQHRVEIVDAILNQLENGSNQSTLPSAGLDLLRDVLRSPMDLLLVERVAKVIIDKFLVQKIDGKIVIKPDIKVIVRVNALACLASIINQCPSVLDQNEYLLIFLNHGETAVNNQIVTIIGNYIDASWRFPYCVDNKTTCDNIHGLWNHLRSIMTDESTHVDTLKCCVNVLKICIPTLMESDHCLHIVEYQDISNLIKLYLRTDFKPLKIELLSLFASLNFKTLYYLEQVHWSKMMSRIACSLVVTLQDRIFREIVINSLTDEHVRVRQAASTALLNILPNLYITTRDSCPGDPTRGPDTTVALAEDLADEHLEILNLAHDSIQSSKKNPISIDRPMINSNKIMSSAILDSNDDRSKELNQNRKELAKKYHHNNICINLKFVVKTLKDEFNDKFREGKVSICSIVQTIYDLCIAYPINEYPSSWDCRNSEYCGCFTTLDMLLTCLENLSEPDVIVGDLETYKNFLLLSCQLLYAVCHQCTLASYENQRATPLHTRQATTRDGDWSELTIKPANIAICLEKYFAHLTRLLCLISSILDEQPYPFAGQNQSFQQNDSKQPTLQPEEFMGSHSTLTSNNQLYSKAFKQLENSYKSSMKNLNQSNERFYQILETCLKNLSSILEFINMKSSLNRVKDLLSYLRITFQTCAVPSLDCTRQLLKSLFGINIIALYQVDPIDWFDDKSKPASNNNSASSQLSKEKLSSQTVHHHLITHPYKLISKYSSFTPAFDYKGLTILDYEIRRRMIVRRRVEERVKALFETNYLEQSVKMRTITDTLKNTITEFTPIVKMCMAQFENRGFLQFQSEVIHFLCYLVLLRVNFHKLENSQHLIKSIDRLLDDCGEKRYASRNDNIEIFLRHSFTLLTLLTYERGPSKPMFQVAAVIKKLDDMRAKICMTNISDKDVSTYIVPLLRCLVEDLFIYRTSYFKLETGKTEYDPQTQSLIAPRGKDDQTDQKYICEQLEPARETVTLRLLEVIDNPIIYDLLVILILESRWDTNEEIKHKKISQSLLSLIPPMLSKQSIRFTNYKSIELTLQVIGHISPNIFQPVNFIFDSLFERVEHPSGKNYPNDSETFHRWMSTILIVIDVLTTQVKEEVFLPKLTTKLQTVESFVEYLLHIAQICIAELVIRINNNKNIINQENSNNNQQEQSGEKHCFLLVIQQLSSYLLYLTHMFQSGLCFHLSKTAVDVIKRETLKTSKKDSKSNRSRIQFRTLCERARDPANNFSLDICEQMFFHIRLIYPDLTILWCNLMMLLNNVDCNQKFWRDLLIYECHHCAETDIDTTNMNQADLNDKESPLSLEDSTESSVMLEDSDKISATLNVKDETNFRRPNYINRPSSLNLSDINQVRRSFIKRISEFDSKDKPLNRNIVEASDNNGTLHELHATLGNTEQCLSPNIELTRRGALCLVLDFVTITMSDVEHIVWLIIYQINDIIRWSHEPPISEYITAVHRNSASSGIFIEAINCNFTNLDSSSMVRRLLWILRDVHYTQYGSLVTLLVKKLLASPELLAFMSVTREIEEFACATVEKLLNDTNRGVVITNEEVYNQLGASDLIHIYSLLDHDLYPNLSKMLIDLSEVTHDMPENSLVGLHANINDSDDDSDSDESDILYKKASLIYCLAEKGETACVIILISALNSIRDHLADKPSLIRINEDKPLACLIISAIYLLASTTRLGHAKRLIKPKCWRTTSSPTEEQPKTQNLFQAKMVQSDAKTLSTDLTKRFSNMNLFNNIEIAQQQQQLTKSIIIPSLDLNSRSSKVDETKADRKVILSRDNNYTEEELCEVVRLACLKGLFLVENIDFLKHTQYEALYEVIIRLARLPLINSFVLTPAQLWKQNIWPIWYDDELDETNPFKTNFAMVTHEILLKDLTLIDDFCDRLLMLGWINKRQFEEAWMTLLGVLSATMSYSTLNGPEFDMLGEPEKKLNLTTSCRLISSITQFLLLSNRQEIGNPLSSDMYPCQTFDSRVIDMTKSIASNLNVLKKQIQGILELLELERKADLSKNLPDTLVIDTSKTKLSHASAINGSDAFNNLNDNGNLYNRYLRVSAERLRFNATEMQDCVIIDGQGDSRRDEPDIGSCIKLLSSVYKQKFRNPDESLYEPTSPDLSLSDSTSPNQSMSSSNNSMFSSINNNNNQSPLHQQQRQPLTPFKIGSSNSNRSPPNQIPPPLGSAICQSILALSDLFTELDQFDWMFETFIDMFKLAERNEDAIQLSYLIVGLCKSVAICCYALPGELVTASAINHRDVMFEKCRQSIEKCMKSDFGPLRLNALSGAFYMLEDSIHIVASGAYELAHFNRFRQSRLTWIQRLAPILLSNDNLRMLTNKPQVMKLLESLCKCVEAQQVHI